MLQVLMLQDDDEYQEEIGGEEGEIAERTVRDETVELSLNSVMGLTLLHTMRIWGTVRQRKVIVLIDCGATHNFVSKDIVEELGLPICKTAGYNIQLGNGESIQGQGVCKNVLLVLPKLEVLEEFFPIALGNSDLILEIQWLQLLGDMSVNWRLLTMSCQMGGRGINIKDDPSLSRAKISCKAMLKTIKAEGEALYIEVVELIGPSTGKEGGEQTEVEELLAQYSNVFRMPNGLPPLRSHEHAIILKEGTAPINVRPYRYPVAQKNEIERLVREMLEGGIIQPSNTPFSRQIILVKKNDGSWRFCVDYRAVNNETIKDRFPIPVIDELVDELGGATIFSKLDLKSGYHHIRVLEEDVKKQLSAPMRAIMNS